jgi:general secretion pathway protein G
MGNEQARACGRARRRSLADIRASAPACAQRGVTAIEALLVIAIVGILVGVALPAYQAYRERVDIGFATADVEMIGGKIQTYYLDNKKFPDSLADVGLADMLDPWGNAYVYVNLSLPGAKPRKDKNLHPLNTDFDLCSTGPDGKTLLPLTAKAAQDDIIRANNGSFIGVAADY